MRSYDLSTKWVKICEAKALEPKESPNEYLKKLSAYMNPDARKTMKGEDVGEGVVIGRGLLTVGG